jgi:hypothetical protein
MVETTQRGCKLPGSNMAVGYWGRDIHAQVFAEQQLGKERALLQEQILLGGLRMELWQEPAAGPVCACYNPINQMADRKCMACHGVGKVPGYLKFGYNTLWMSASDPDNTLTNLRLTRNYQSSKLELVEGALVGVVESTDKPFSRTVFGATWGTSVQFYLMESDYSSITVEYSLDAGAGWLSLSNLPAETTQTGTIRFRVTMSRTDANARSPLFEMLSARYATIPLSNPDVNGVYRKGPWILIMREPPSTGHRKQDYGDQPIEEGLEMWTAGLAMFDSSIPYGSAGEVIKGPEVLMQLLDGARAGNRYMATAWKNSDPMAYIIESQTFKMRITDDVDPMKLVW